jgi:V8-like Glu-specific endopeptidase
VYGYAGDNPMPWKEVDKQGITYYRHPQMGHPNTIDYIDKGIVYHRSDTTKGQSGSPILVTLKGKTFAIGIHIQSGLP